MSNIDNIALAVPCINQSQQTRVLTANIHGRGGGGEGVDGGEASDCGNPYYLGTSQNASPF